MFGKTKLTTCLYAIMLFGSVVSLVNGNVVRLTLDKETEGGEDNHSGDNHITLDDSVSLQLKNTFSGFDIFNSFRSQTSVHHFARHTLCRHLHGQKRFYKALKSKLCGLRADFIKTLVEDLCARKDKELDRWVAEIYDLDGDNYVTHFEN